MSKRILPLGVVFIVSFVLCLTPPLTLSSRETEPPAEARLAEESTVRGKLDVLVGLVNRYRQDAPDKARQYGEQALGLLEDHPGEFKDEFNDERSRVIVRVKILNGLCWAYGVLGEFRKALDAGNRAERLARRIGAKKELAVNLSTLANIYLNSSQYHKALDYSLKATKAGQAIGYKRGTASALVSTARIHRKLGEFDKALVYYEKALAISKELKNRGNVAWILTDTGTVYWDMKKYKKALDYFNRGLKIMKEVNSLLGQAFVLNNISCVYSDTGDYRTALQYNMRALAIYKKLKTNIHIARSYRNIGRNYGGLGQFKRGLRYLDRGLAMVEKIGVTDLQQTYYQEYTRLYEHMGDYRKALYYHKKFKEIGEELLDDARNKRIAHLQVVYDVENKKKENLLLKKNNTIQALELFRKGAALDRQRLLGYFLILVAVLLVIIAAIAVNRSRIRKKAQQVLQESEKKLKQMNVSKDKLFAIIAHDLGNPLNSLLLSSGHLKRHFKSLPPGDLDHFIQNIHGQAKGLTGLLDNLLQWSLVQTGKIRYNPETLDMHPLIQQTLEHARYNAGEKQIQLVSGVTENSMALADKQMMKTVLRNLVSNAVKYTRPGGRISIASNDSGNTIEITVSDTGIGIEEDRLQRLFNGELQESTPGTVNEKGTGLGLTLCKEFVETNGGEIRVQSNLQKGSQFSFTLPKKEIS